MALKLNRTLFWQGSITTTFLLISFACAHSELKGTPKREVFVFDQALAEKLVLLSLTCTVQEYPNYFEREISKARPRQIHPVFYGCYDWHSAVHGHWTLVQVLKKYPDNSARNAILQRLDQHFRSDLIQGEILQFERDPLYERPYGWAWFLRLVAEIRTLNHSRAMEWAKALKPLEELLVRKSMDYLDQINRPVRYGTHANTAFALLHMLAYAEVTGSHGFRSLIVKKTLELFKKDLDCPIHYEPSTGDFLSGCLAEAQIMGHILEPKPFEAWLDGFLSKKLWTDSFLEPVVPIDKKDPIIGHLMGLLFHKAWTLRDIAAHLPEDDHRKIPFEESAKAHGEVGLSLMFDAGYGGTHWLASFAVFHFSEAFR